MSASIVMNVEDRAERSDLNRATTRLLLLALVLAVLHIFDHVLRFDHSGWPFRSKETPFTYSLLAIPILLFALLGPRRLDWWRWMLLLVATLATLYAHVWVETPHMQWAMWAHDRSADLHQQGFRNMLHVSSGAPGVLSAVVAMELNVFAVITTVAMLTDGMRRRAGLQGLIC